MSPQREKIEQFLKTLLKEDYYFSIKYKNKKEIFYTTKNFSMENIDYGEINAFKIYVKIYNKSARFLMFASRVSLVIVFWRKDKNLDTYKCNIFTQISTLMASSSFLNNTTQITINNLKIPYLKVYKELHAHVAENPIDIVYTWVDNTDSEWIKKKEEKLQHHKGHTSPTAVD